MQMGMLTTGHAFIFRSLQRALVFLPGFENGSFLAGGNVGCLDYIHGALESARLVDRWLIGMCLIMHAVPPTLACLAGLYAWSLPFSQSIDSRACRTFSHHVLTGLEPQLLV